MNFFVSVLLAVKFDFFDHVTRRMRKQRNLKTTKKLSPLNINYTHMDTLILHPLTRAHKIKTWKFFV